MKSLKCRRGEEALVIVAHPDDETIWMGGFIALHPELSWTILSLCRASDKDRAPKFRRVAKSLSAKGIIDDLDDEGKISEYDAKQRIRKIILKYFKNKTFAYLFTHGGNGEYGHPRHKSVNRAVRRMIAEKELKIENVFFFNYKKITKYKLAPKNNSDLIVKLSNQIFKKKLNLMTKLYGFAPDGIDAGYSTNPEAFKIFKIKK